MLPQELEGRKLLALWETVGMPHLATWALELDRAYPEVIITFDDIYATLQGATGNMTLSEYRAWRTENPDTDRPNPDEMIEQFVDLARRVTAITDRLDPVITKKTITLPISGNAAILLAGCFHLGGRYTFHDWGAQRLDEAFAIPRTFIAFFGDTREGFYPRFRDEKTVMQQALNLEMQDELMLWVYRKFAPKLLWELSSQHGNEWDERRGAGNSIKDLCRRFDVTYFDGVGYVKLILGEQEYRIAVAHKFKGHSYHNPNHSQWRALFERFPLADVVAQADKHNVGWQRREVYADEVEYGGRKSPEVWLIQIGTAKGGPDPYTIRGWPQGQLGWPFILLSQDRHKVKVTLDLEDVRRHCEK